jgi:hypothetical protein
MIFAYPATAGKGECVHDSTSRKVVFCAFLPVLSRLFPSNDTVADGFSVCPVSSSQSVRIPVQGRGIFAGSVQHFSVLAGLKFTPAHFTVKRGKEKNFHGDFRGDSMVTSVVTSFLSRGRQIDNGFEDVPLH